MSKVSLDCHRQTLRPPAPHQGNRRLRRRGERLQVENSGAVTRIAAAVDASLATVKLAVAAKADC